MWKWLMVGVLVLAACDPNKVTTVTLPVSKMPTTQIAANPICILACDVVVETIAVENSDDFSRTSTLQRKGSPAQ